MPYLAALDSFEVCWEALSVPIEGANAGHRVILQKPVSQVD
jgi:hypothetical protein